MREIIQEIIDIFNRDYPTASDETYEFFHDVLNVLRNSKSEWISVKDRLPDDVEDVIVCDEFGLVCPAYYYTCDECWMYSFAAERCEHKITHWMPLPEPPESEVDADV